MTVSEISESAEAALAIGKQASWDYSPVSDASQQYTRSHMDLTDFDIVSRYPRPEPFTGSDGVSKGET